MKLKIALLVAASVAVFALVSRFEGSRDPREQHAALAESLLHAMEQSDYGAFVHIADTGMRKLRREDFVALAGQNAARLKGGHELAFIRQSERSGITVSEWAIRFRNGAAPARLRLGVRDGEIASLLFR
jgi:hypothetical protein